MLFKKKLSWCDEIIAKYNKHLKRKLQRLISVLKKSLLLIPVFIAVFISWCAQQPAYTSTQMILSWFDMQINATKVTRDYQSWELNKAKKDMEEASNRVVVHWTKFKEADIELQRLSKLRDLTAQQLWWK